MTRGLMKAKIRKQNVIEVIKPRDQVFLGHKIPNCQISANLRKEIVKRALKSVDKPSIVSTITTGTILWNNGKGSTIAPKTLHSVL